MLTRRRLSDQLVDAAGFCGGELVVSFRNGCEHVRPTPTPSEDPPEPLDSRVMVHSYSGASLVEGALNERSDYVRAAGVSADGVVACRVGELPAGNQFATATPFPSRSTRNDPKESVEKLVFFSGRMRLSEMLFAAVEEDALSEHGKLTRQECSERFPMLCLRSPQGPHMAVFARTRSSLTACVSEGVGRCVQGNNDPFLGVNPKDYPCPSAAYFASLRYRERQIEFTGRTIACIGAGRPFPSKGDEVTILLDDHTIVVYGFPSPSGGSAPTTTTTTAAAADVGHRSPEEDGFPRFEAVLTCSFPLEEPPSEASPVSVVWAGRHTLWIVYKNGTVCALQTVTRAQRGRDSGRDEGGEGNEEDEVVEMTVGFVGTLTPQPASLVHCCFQPDNRSSALHYCFRTCAVSEAEGRLFYGTVRLPPDAGRRGSRSGDEAWSRGVQEAVFAQQGCLSFGEHVYGLRYDCGRFRLLTQSSPGDGPLFITSIARGSLANMGRGVPPSLRLPHGSEEEEDLAELSLHVVSSLQQINDPGSGGHRLRERADVMEALQRLHDLRQCVFALFPRAMQRMMKEGRGDAQRASFAWRKLQQAQPLFLRKQVELSICLMLATLGCLDAVEQPLFEALDLQACRENASATQELLKQVIAATFPASAETDAALTNLWPTKVTLCIDVILEDLGVSSNYSFAQVMALPSALSDSGVLSPTFALLVLYYSYRAFFSSSSASSEGEQQRRQRQREENEARNAFLSGSGVSCDEFNGWAFASYAVDHGHNPTARLPSDGTAADKEREGGDGAEQPYVYLLGPVLDHLGVPPVLALLPTLVDGLMHVQAVDTAYRLMPGVLSLHTKKRELPPVLGLKLLFIALQAGADRSLSLLFFRLRGTPLEAAVTQALALAMLRQGNVLLAPGLATVGFPQEQLIIATLRSFEDVALAERVLLRFYALMHRFADALAVCESIASRDPVEGQRLSTVASLLRSLIPREGNSDMQRNNESGTSVDEYSPSPDSGPLPPTSRLAA